MSLTHPKASMQIRSAPPMHAPLKIAIIAHSLYPIAQPYAGGLEMITQLLCDELVARAERHVASASGGDGWRKLYTCFLECT